MSKSKLPFQSLLLVLFLLASACNSPAESPTTIVQLPTSTKVWLPPVLNTNTPTPKSIGVPFPTLASNLQSQFYEDLRSNRGCELPCLLGIIPGATSWLDAKSFLEAYSLNKPVESDQAASSQDHVVYFVQIQTSIDISLIMRLRLVVGENGLVQYINFDATSSREGSYVENDQHLSKYSLREVFRRHGLPNSIFMKPIKRGVYTLHIVYDELKMVIGLTGQATRISGGEYEVCPNLGDGNPLSLTVGLAAPSDPIDTKNLLDYPFYESELSLEDVTGLGIDQFYTLMSSSESPACFRAK
jgi:hypothetical protein